jgi:hypothetical protein
MTKYSNAMMVLAALALPAPALAQALDPAGRPAGFERRITAGVTIPLGAGRGAAGTPQLELRAVGQRFDAADRARVRPATMRETRIGLTLETQPRLTVGGQPVSTGQDKLGLSTLGWVAIGVVTVGVVGGLLFIDALNDASD